MGSAYWQTVLVDAVRTLACPLPGCPGEGVFMAWRWHTGKWREVMLCDTCQTRYYSGAVRVGVVGR